MPLLQEVTDGVLRTTEYQASITVGEGKNPTARVQSSLGQEAERELHTSRLVHDDLCRFANHDASLTFAGASYLARLPEVTALEWCGRCEPLGQRLPTEA
ncbi:hypothetical protein ADL25_34150 [Streptomyces sp. NRRL F-5122]|nr:hypothetical protein ADL25_34150 [Streptomyces sp. NRRL F-5122]